MSDKYYLISPSVDDRVMRTTLDISVYGDLQALLEVLIKDRSIAESIVKGNKIVVLGKRYIPKIAVTLVEVT